MVDTTITTPVNYPYSAIQLTEEIMRIDNVWGRLQELNVFPAEGIATTTVEVAFEEGRIRILAAEERGSPGSQGTQAPENSVILKVPHIPHRETIKPEDLQDKFVFGSGRRQLRSVDTESAKKLNLLRKKHALTLEFLRMGALKGLIKDGRNTTIYNLFTVFDVVKKQVDFLLGTDSTNVRAKCAEVINHMKLNLLGETMTGVHALVSQSFYDKLTNHPNVEKFFLSWQAAMQLANNVNMPFPFGGILWEPYIATSTGIDGNSYDFIADDEGHAWPTGTMEASKTVFAPPHHVSFVNTLGPEVFVSPKILDHGAGVELASQSNPLPIWTIPALLVEVGTSN